LTENEVGKIVDKSYTSSQTLGLEIADAYYTTHSSYYMCFIYNSTIYYVGTISSLTSSQTRSNTVTVTTDYTKASKVNVIYEGNSEEKTQIKFIDGNSEVCLYYYNYSNYNENKYLNYYYNTSRFDQTSVTNSTYSYSYTFKPSFVLTYRNGNTFSKEAYQLGYRIKETNNSQRRVYVTESTVFDFEDHNKRYGTTYNVPIKKNTVIEVSARFVYPVATLEYNYLETGKYYDLYIFYKETSTSQEVELDGNDIVSIKYTILSNGNETTITVRTSSFNVPDNDVEESDFSENYGLELTSSWKLGAMVANPYVSYVKNIDTDSYDSLDNLSDLMNAIDSGDSYIYRYTGTTTSEEVYYESTEGSTTSYTHNYGYQLGIVNNMLVWQYYYTSLTDDAGTTMDSILAEANLHFGDNQYGKYYGMYYAYSGTSKYISSGIYLKNKYIYRIMPNATNTAFEWVEVQPYYEESSPDFLERLGTGNAQVGDILHSTGDAFEGYFRPGWYKVIVDEKTNVVNLVKFNDLSISIVSNNSSDYTSLTNEKNITKTFTGKDYLGYSGTFTIEISAVYRVNNNGVYTDYVKTYKLKFVGMLNLT
jgi:hypothetical protein